jgi:hypothetical protein
VLNISHVQGGNDCFIAHNYNIEKSHFISQIHHKFITIFAFISARPPLEKEYRAELLLKSRAI